MKFGLMENGIDSLKTGIVFYNTYLNTFINNEKPAKFEKDTYLKL